MVKKHSADSNEKTVTAIALLGLLISIFSPIALIAGINFGQLSGFSQFGEMLIKSSIPAGFIGIMTFISFGKMADDYAQKRWSKKGLAVGIDGQIEVTQNGVSITRQGIFSCFLSMVHGCFHLAPREIPWSKVVAVDFREGSRAMNGQIKFNMHGSTRANENLVAFTYKENAAFKKLKQNVDERLGSKPMEKQPNFDPLKDIERLAALMKDGLLTAEEFEIKKKDLLNRM